MTKKNIARAGGWITLAAIALIGMAFWISGSDLAWPHLCLLIAASWLHGICWGYLYALEGRLTWL